MTSLDPHIFRAYDIRGIAGEQITEEISYAIGQAYGSELRELYETNTPKVAVGRDARTHSPAYHSALIEGLKAAGCYVLDIGETPSPTNYFTVCSQNLDGSIQITASHNPGEYNGFKFQTRNAHSFAGEKIQQLLRRIQDGNVLTGEGSSEEIDAVTPYIEHLTKLFDGVGKDLHVVIDAGNGVGGPCYTKVLKGIGCKVTELYTEPDGTFPNHPADPSKWDTLKDLQKTVTDLDADIGLAFDGDGDRLGVVDEKGEVKTADDILLLLAQDHLKRNPEGMIVSTVSSSGVFATEVPKWGGKHVMSIVGHAFVEDVMTEHNSLLGGEQSGHFFCFEDYYRFDDAIVAGLRLIKILSVGDNTFSEFFADFPKVYQTPESRPHCPDDKKTEVVQKVITHFEQDYPVLTMDGARIDFGDGAWAGIRQSNTSPCLSICIEARSPEKLQEVEDIVIGHLKEYSEVEL